MEIKLRIDMLNIGDEFRFNGQSKTYIFDGRSHTKFGVKKIHYHEKGQLLKRIIGASEFISKNGELVLVPRFINFIKP